MGFVKIGNVLVPESSKKPTAWCRICTPPIPLYDEFEEVQHARNHVKRDEAEEARREHSTRWKLRELHEGGDLELEAWMRSPAGRAWWNRTIERK